MTSEISLFQILFNKNRQNKFLDLVFSKNYSDVTLEAISENELFDRNSIHHDVIAFNVAYIDTSEQVVTTTVNVFNSSQVEIRRDIQILDF